MHSFGNAWWGRNQSCKGDKDYGVKSPSCSFLHPIIPSLSNNFHMYFENPTKLRRACHRLPFLTEAWSLHYCPEYWKHRTHNHPVFGELQEESRGTWQFPRGQIAVGQSKNQFMIVGGIHGAPANSGALLLGPRYVPWLVGLHHNAGLGWQVVAAELLASQATCGFKTTFLDLCAELTQPSTAGTRKWAALTAKKEVAIVL